MPPKSKFQWFLMPVLLAGLLYTAISVQAAQQPSRSAQSGEVTAFDLIIAMNTLRASYGLPALVEDPIINAVAQSTAEIMAANQMSWHIGDVDGRLASAGYGGGAKVWATENFAVGNHSIDEIMLVWSDESHMIPAVNPAYCHVGAGVAKSANGMTYYVLQAAYTAGKSCGEYKSPGGPTQPGGGTGDGSAVGVSQLIVPVKIASPGADGKVFHVVEAGQSFWAIAVAYKITIRDLEIWNNISRDSKLQIGQRLFIPSSNTEGYATPTPVGMVQVSTPDLDGKVIHAVEAYQTLITIAQAYEIQVETILSLNGIQADWPLQIGQKLVINPGSVTPSPTPRPLTPIEKLTPESDGKYYHIIKSGETLLWIAELYEVTLGDLIAWNGLSASSVIRPDQKLLLQVTPPATVTPTPAPATSTPTATVARPTATRSLTPTHATASPTVAVNSSAASGGTAIIWFVSIGLAAGGLFLAILLSRKKP
ncbi:MAG TPA: LysM peptidoglycan-binding domain-containing protein [Anaerolineales bacterium]